MGEAAVPAKVKVLVWGKAGGRCQFGGCNRILWRDDLTKSEFNSAYLAHIVADSPGGPRGHPTQSELLREDPANLMLLCDKHHRLIDIADVDGHPVELLMRMKAAHEARIERLTGIDQGRESLVVLYGANIGDNSPILGRQGAHKALVPSRYPLEDKPVLLGMSNGAATDFDAAFWESERNQLVTLFNRYIRPRQTDGTAGHVSLFGLAPQPLLMLLGSLFTDLAEVDVFQRHREPHQTWCWPDPPAPHPDYVIARPPSTQGPPALVLALSATVTDDRIRAVLGNDASIWRISVERPHNDMMKSRIQLMVFRQTIRLLLDEIKSHYAGSASLHVFPAAPASTCVEFGRVLMPKADLPIRVYDQNRGLGGFVAALDLNARAGVIGESK